jgi:hypothetical protein
MWYDVSTAEKPAANKKGFTIPFFLDLYDKIKEDVAFRRKWAEQCGFGFDLLSVVPNVPKCTEKVEAAVAT